MLKIMLPGLDIPQRGPCGVTALSDIGADVTFDLTAVILSFLILAIPVLLLFSRLCEVPRLFHNKPVRMHRPQEQEM